MPVPKELVVNFEEDFFYHVFCKSVGNSLLFDDGADKYHFRKCYFEFLNDFVETHAYNILDNHVHFVVKIKSSREIFKNLSNYQKEFLTKTQMKFLEGKVSLHTLISKQFHRLFIKYTIYFNRIYDRKGHLFNRPFKRKRIDDLDYLIRLFVYVHANQIHHKLSATYEDCKWSSFQELLGNGKTSLQREEVYKLFGGKGAFIRLHKELSIKYSDGDME